VAVLVIKRELLFLFVEKFAWGYTMKFYWGFSIGTGLFGKHKKSV